MSENSSLEQEIQQLLVVVGRGRAAATVGSTTGSTGRDLKDLLTRNRPDSAWANELRELRASIGVRGPLPV